MAKKQKIISGTKHKPARTATKAARTLPKKAAIIKPAARPARPKTAVSKVRRAPRPAPAAKIAKRTPVKASPARTSIDQKTLDRIRGLLIHIRDRLSGQIHAQSKDSLKYVDDASSEDRTDDFDRELALNIVSSEHDALFEVNSALRRIDDKNYGICDSCNQSIEKTRLQALPFTRMCITCQSEHERGRNRFRPFGETISQYNEPAGDTEEAEAEEHE